MSDLADSYAFYLLPWTLFSAGIRDFALISLTRLASSQTLVLARL